MRHDWGLLTDFQTVKQDEHISKLDIRRILLLPFPYKSKSTKEYSITLEEEASIVNMYLNSLKPSLEDRENAALALKKEKESSKYKTMKSLIQETIRDNEQNRNIKAVNWLQ